MQVDAGCRPVVLEVCALQNNPAVSCHLGDTLETYNVGHDAYSRNGLPCRGISVKRLSGSGRQAGAGWGSRLEVRCRL